MVLPKKVTVYLGFTPLAEKPVNPASILAVLYSRLHQAPWPTPLLYKTAISDNFSDRADEKTEDYHEDPSLRKTHHKTNINHFYHDCLDRSIPGYGPGSPS